MTKLPTTVASISINITRRALVANLATLEAHNTRRSISPTRFLALISFLLTLATRSFIRLTMALVTLAPLLINHTITSIVVLLINPTTIHQIREDTNLLITNHLLDFRT